MEVLIALAISATFAVFAGWHALRTSHVSRRGGEMPIAPRHPRLIVIAGNKREADHWVGEKYPDWPREHVIYVQSPETLDRLRYAQGDVVLKCGNWRQHSDISGILAAESRTTALSVVRPVREVCLD